MNISVKAIAIATFIWGLLFEPRFFLIFASLLSIYTLLGYWVGETNSNKKFNIMSYKDSGDPTGFAKMEIKLKKLDKFLEDYNSKNPQSKLSYTQIGLKSLGEAMKRVKTINGYFSFGNFMPLKDVTSSLIVDIEGKNVINLSVPGCGSSSIRGIRSKIKGKIGKIKRNKDKRVKRQMNVIKYIPSFMIGMLINTLSFLSYNLGIPFPLIKFKKRHFGNCMLTNVIGFNVEDALPSLVNIARTVMVEIINTPKIKAVAENGKIVKGKVLNLNFCFDPRYGKGACFLEALAIIKDVWLNPEKYV